MTSELVERLRKYPKPERCNNIFRKTSENAHEAADEIERLRAALREIADCKTFTDREYMIGIARAALEERT